MKIKEEIKMRDYYANNWRVQLDSINKQLLYTWSNEPKYLSEYLPKYTKDDIKLVNFNPKKRVTTVKWSDGTISQVRAQEQLGDTYNPEMGMAMCICKKVFGNKGNFNKIFKKWLPEGENEIDISNK